MPSGLRLWQIEDERPRPIQQGRLDLESRIENWLRDDIGMVNDDLLVVGQQVETAYGGVIDLLAIDSSGDLVILELKRDRTPRDVVAQTLDYASWVQRLSHEDVEKIASDFFRDDNTLELAFREKFREDLPDVLNESHRMYIVASSLDPATERIIEYLSETHSLDINAATFTYFQTPGGVEMIGRSMLLDEMNVQERANTTGASSRRRRNSTLAELREVAQQNGVVDLWDRAIQEIRLMVDRTVRYQSTVSMNVRTAEGSRSVLSLIPGWSSSENGLIFRLRPDIISEHFGVSEDEIRNLCGLPPEVIPGVEAGDRWGNEYFFDDERLSGFLGLLRNGDE